eukprot:756058-Hanusia_phi.AAC.3
MTRTKWCPYGERPGEPGRPGPVMCLPGPPGGADSSGARLFEGSHLLPPFARVGGRTPGPGGRGVQPLKTV